jgi:phage shock protein C
MGKRLYRSSDNKKIFGVCGGLAEYLNIDPTLVRIIWVLVGLVYGTGVIAYFVAALIMPERNGNTFNSDSSESGFENSEYRENYDDDSGKSRTGSEYDSSKTRNIIGGALVVFGLWFLFKEFFHWLDFKIVLAVIFIAVGALVVSQGRRGRF